MNIFALDPSPVLAAQMMCDRHVVKMILESAQLLSTAHRVLDGTLITKPRKHYQLPDSREGALYKATHINHPSAVWARAHCENYAWLCSHFEALLDEYTYRYDKVHACARLLPDLRILPHNMRLDDTSYKFEFSVAMKDEYKVGDNPVEMYRHYYRTAKKGIATWKRRSPPTWW